MQSKKDNEFYIGSANDLRKRVKEHNAGKVKSTKARTPFDLIYYEAYRSEKDARERERKLKLRGQARRQLFERIKESALPALKKT